MFRLHIPLPKHGYRHSDSTRGRKSAGRETPDSAAHKQQRWIPPRNGPCLSGKRSSALPCGHRKPDNSPVHSTSGCSREPPPAGSSPVLGATAVPEKSREQAPASRCSPEDTAQNAQTGLPAAAGSTDPCLSVPMPDGTLPAALHTMPEKHPPVATCRIKTPQPPGDPRKVPLSFPLYRQAALVSGAKSDYVRDGQSLLRT